MLRQSSTAVTSRCVGAPRPEISRFGVRLVSECFDLFDCWCYWRLGYYAMHVTMNNFLFGSSALLL